MSGAMQDLGSGFYHIRGSLKLGGVLELGTHCALVELESGRFVFLDSYTLDPDTRAEVNRLTDGGRLVEAIINLHPFHTLHCEWMHHAFPQAKLYGTARHHRRFPDLPWQDEQCEMGRLSEIFGPHLEFSIPRGVHMVCEDESVHFSSVLAYHPASATLFVDDTLSQVRLPFPLKLLPMSGRLDFHPTLAKALEPEPQAADEFREWALDLGTRWASANRIAMAHNSIADLTAGADFPQMIGEALGRVKPVLDKHRARQN